MEDAEGYVTAYGSDFHTNDQPAKTDSILVQRLRAAGAIVVGKTNTPEFGYKGVTDNVPFGGKILGIKNIPQEGRLVDHRPL